MHHSVDDARRAASSARTDPYDSRWHPILDAYETSPGQWDMVDSTGFVFGHVRIVRRGDEIGYRADSTPYRSHPAELVGYFKTLRTAAKQVHMHYINRHSGPITKPGHNPTTGLPIPRD